MKVAKCNRYVWFGLEVLPRVKDLTFCNSVNVPSSSLSAEVWSWSVLEVGPLSSWTSRPAWPTPDVSTERKLLGERLFIFKTACGHSIFVDQSTLPNVIASYFSQQCALMCSGNKSCMHWPQVRQTLPDYNSAGLICIFVFCIFDQTFADYDSAGLISTTFPSPPVLLALSSRVLFSVQLGQLSTLFSSVSSSLFPSFTGPSSDSGTLSPLHWQVTFLSKFFVSCSSSGISEDEKRRRKESNNLSTRISFFAWLFEVSNIIFFRSTIFVFLSWRIFHT